MFDDNAQGTSRVEENIRKWSKKQVQEEATQSINAKYEMPQAPTEQLCHMT